MRAKLLVFLSLLMVCTAQAGPPTADELLETAKAKARAQDKAIFVHFGASWCGWCRRLDTFLNRGDVRKVVQKYFIPVELIVMETGKNQRKENAGADALLQKWGGPDGLPYSAFLDAHGTLIVNSKRPGGDGGASLNIGYPAGPEEIDWFMTMVKRAAPKITGEDLKVLETALRRQKL